MEVSFDLEWHGKLTEDQFAPVVDAWCSLPAKGEERVRLRADVSDGIRRYKFSFSEPPEVLPLDSAVHFQVFTYVRARHHEIPVEGGAGSVFLADMAAHPDKPVNVPLRLTALMVYEEKSPDAHRGFLKISGDIVRKDGKPILFTDPDPSKDLVPSNKNYLHRVMQTEVERSIAFGDPETWQRIKKSVRMTLDEMLRVRCRYYANSVLTNVPGYMYMRFWDRHQAPAPHVIEKYMTYAIGRAGLSPERWMKDIKAYAEPGPLTWHQLRAADTMVYGLSLLAFSLLYISDYAPRRDGLEITELFNDALRRGVGDCEDFANLVGYICWWVANHEHDSVLLKAAKVVLEHYVVAACLLSVRGAKIGDGDGHRPTLDDENGVGAHMQLTLFPRLWFLKALHHRLPGVRLPLHDGSFGEEDATASDRKMVVLMLEGTGNMYSLQGLAEHYLSGSEEETMRLSLAKANNAFGFLVDPEFAAKGADVEIPASWRRWSIRRLPSGEGRRTDSPNMFYRLFRWLSVVGPDVLEVEFNGQRFSLAAVDMGTNQPLHGGQKGFSMGAPVMDIARGTDTTVLVPSPAWSEEAKTILENWKHHLPPAEPIREVDHRRVPGFIEDYQATNAQIRVTAQEFEHIPLEIPEGSDETLLTLYMRGKDYKDDYLVDAVESIRRNPFIRRRSVYTEMMHEGVFNVVISVTMAF